MWQLEMTNQQGVYFMKTEKLISLLAISVFLSGCAASVKFIDREDGLTYMGQTGGTAGRSGEINAVIQGKEYTGEWIYSPMGGGYTLGTGSALSSSGASAFGMSSGVTVSSSGNGLITMKSRDSDYLRCVFTFSGNTGFGDCERNDGKRFDVIIKR